MINDYLEILYQSLEKKVMILSEISDYNEKQTQIFLREEEVDFDTFDQYINEKEELIQKILKLDSAFESLYEKISEPLRNQKEKYTDKIKRIQDMISLVTEKSVEIQAQETRNKALVENYFRTQKKKLRQKRQWNTAAYSYYKSMNGISSEAQILDDKN